MRLSKLSPVVALLLATAVGAPLSGCSVSIIEPSASPSATGAGRDDSPVGDAPPTAGDDESTTPASGFSADGQQRRDTLAAAATTTMPCPDGPLTADGAVVRVEGTCDELVIEIDAGAVIADDVGTLMLAGSGTTVYVDTVSSVTVTGSASSVFWAGETPTVADSGAANVLRRG